MSFSALAQFLFGLLSLVLGAEFLVRGSARLASSLGMSPLIIGLTVVAFGTSSPEMAVSVISALSSQPDISLGNVIGSNIFNILFILGISAVITPLMVSRQLIRLDVPLMIFVSFLLFFLGLDGIISSLEGSLLFSGIVIYTLFLIYQSRRENILIISKDSEKYRDGRVRSEKLSAHLLLVCLGLVLLVFGSRWLTKGSVAIAQLLGVSELIIGLTIVAAGTSLPEAATSIIAAIRGERDIAVGNIVGSNIFNILAVLGLSSIVSSKGIEVSSAALWFDIPVMIAAALACFPIFFTGSAIARWEGLLFFGYYTAYTAYLFMKSTHHQALTFFNRAMLLFVIPITLITLVIIFIYALRKEPEKHAR